MNRILTLTFCCLISTGLTAQKIEKLISEKPVTKFITELTSDDLRGRSALVPEDIDKAAELIQEEFKKSKLEFFNSLTSYRQEFQKDQISLENITANVNGKTLRADQMLLISDQTTIKLSGSTPVTRLKEGQNLFQVYQTLRRDSTDHIVIVPSSQEENFHQLYNYFSKPRVAEKNTNKPGSTLYITGVDSIIDISIDARQKRDNLTMSNVVGILPGKSKKDEFVIFSSHYDHIGIQQPVAGDSIANGADDDASGTTAVVALANYFSKMKDNERTLIFVAFTAEEIGGFGSRYFSQQLDPDKVVAMFNIEMIGKPSKWGTNSAFITGFERSNFGEILQKNLQGTQFNFYPDPYLEENLFYRSDNATLARLGVPAHTISTDQIPSDPYYHTVDDEVGTLDMNNLIVTIRSIALSAKSIINGTDTPSRIDKASVK